MEDFPLVDGGAEFGVHRDGPSLSEIGGEGLLDARPRGAEEGGEIALGEA